MEFKTATEPNQNQSKSEVKWIHLDDPKSFSRVLYTNPVCFLTTTTMAIEQSSPSSLVFPKRNAMVISWLTAINNSGGFIMSVNKRRHTASILLNTFRHRRRQHSHCDKNGTTCRMNNETIFGLCVPVKGMEDLVLSVGKMSGRWGSSKFPSDHHQSQQQQQQQQQTEELSTSSTQHQHEGDCKNESNAKPPSKKKKRFEHGIQGLVAVKLGGEVDMDVDMEIKINKSTDTNADAYADTNTTHELSTASTILPPPDNSEECFAIQGTVAHLKCRVKNFLSEANTDETENGMIMNTMDENDHHLILAEVVDGYVKKDYWNDKKKLFHPVIDIRVVENEGGNANVISESPPPPYMTFFGSQTFGYVVCNNTT